MIVKLSDRIGCAGNSLQAGSRGSTLIGNAVLERLRVFWHASRGSAAAPLADGLYLSDLIAEMPHVLLCFRDGEAFRIEFSGSEVQDLLGFDPTGEVLRQDDYVPVLMDMARCAEEMILQTVPRTGRGDCWRSLLLPYVDARQRVMVMLAGLVTEAPERSAEILNFSARGAGPG